MRSRYLELYIDDNGNKDVNLLSKKIYLFEKCLNLIQNVYDTCEILEKQLKASAGEVWNHQLTDLSKCGVFDNYHLIVNISKTNDLRIYSNDKKVIGCSHFSPKSPWLFKNDCIGFCYNLDERYLIGMSPSDCGLASTVVRNEEEMCRLVYDRIKVNDGVYLDGVLSDFIPYYMPSSLQKSGSYSEIVLRSDAYPTAIYTPVEQLRYNYNNVVAASALYKLPIVLYDCDKNSIKFMNV